jgi:hypothetical protein
MLGADGAASGAEGTSGVGTGSAGTWGVEISGTSMCGSGTAAGSGAGGAGGADLGGGAGIGCGRLSFEPDPAPVPAGGGWPEPGAMPRPGEPAFGAPGTLPPRSDRSLARECDRLANPVAATKRACAPAVGVRCPRLAVLFRVGAPLWAVTDIERSAARPKAACSAGSPSHWSAPNRLTATPTAATKSRA